VEITETRGKIAIPTLDARRLEITLQEIAEGWLSEHYAVAVGQLEVFATAALFPIELQGNAGAHPRRQMTFRAGRACARAALGELGVAPAPIPVGNAGAPIWPLGIVGSISHTDAIAAAVVARSPPVTGLGLDFENDEPLDDATMVRLVCRREELVPGCDSAHPESLRRGKLLFVVKEAVYKLYQPLTDTFLDFHDLRVTFDEAANTFRAELVDPQLPAVRVARVIVGRFAQTEGFVIALAALGQVG
jgi:4'-phosphopantetheinyl transferase EntD